ncbi:MAG: AlpA family phage regulatory protein [Arcobacteraceae bacterium]|nr:AlpA family phage regulatory protein [Arcobacteraceae bacterium]
MTNLIRIPKVMKKTGLAKSTIWWMISRGKFPKQIKLSPRISVWKEIDVDNWIEQHLKIVEIA